MDRKQHWEAVYRAKQPTEVSWFQAEATLSAQLIAETVPDRNAPILDVGGGTSVLVAALSAAGYTDVTVLDLSGAAIAAARAAMGPDADAVRWIEADILEAQLPPDGLAFWHDRAVFHFLTEQEDRRRYLAQASRAVRDGGHLLVATFADDGPTRCSGLAVARYSPVELQAQFAEGFRLVSAHREAHRTPAGGLQAFTYCLLRRVSPGA